MNPFESELDGRLEAIRQAGLFRELRKVESPQGIHVTTAGRVLVNFSSNDYLGLASHPALKTAAVSAVERFGCGGGASRLICGSLTPHHKLEEALAEFKGTQAAITFSSGYACAIGTITALVGPGDVIVLDKLAHASLVDAARLSGARLRVFAHNDLGELESILKWARSSRGGHRGDCVPGGKPGSVMVVTESVFSMDGDRAPLKELVEIKDRYGAWLMLDEAHATGLYGLHRRGLAEVERVSERVEVQMGTLGKALGASGGYICGSRRLVQLLINRARSFIFSTAPVPAAAAAAEAGVRLVMSREGEERSARLWQRVSETPPSLNTSGASARAILPIIVGNEARTVQAASALREKGFLIPAVRYPAVARGRARLRVTLSADHTHDDVAQLATAIEQLGIAGSPSTEALAHA